MTFQAENGLRNYWTENGLAHLPLNIVSLDDVQPYIDPQQYSMVKSWAPGVVIACTELDKQSFNTLVFIKGEEGNTDTVTTDGRSLYEVTKTIEQKYPNLSELFSLNNWFKDVQEIYDDFDYAKFQYLVLRAPTDENERKASNNGPLYLEGGNHRSLALAIKINLEGYEFKSVKAVILLRPPTQL